MIGSVRFAHRGGGKDFDDTIARGGYRLGSIVTALDLNVHGLI